MKQLHWTTSLYGRGLEAAVPTASGVYVIAHVTRLHGLPIHINWLYVGQSKNLRRRYCEHVHWTEPNPSLDAIRLDHTHEFWWVTAPVDELNTLEADLIDQLNPPANRRRGNRPAA